MKCDSEGRAFRLTKQDVAALVDFASADKTRTHLTCVHFEPEDGTAVATDGHALVAAKNCGTYRGEPFQVPTKHLVEMAKLLKKDETLAVERHQIDGGAEATVTAPNGAMTRIAIEDNFFPAWRQVIPGDAESPARRVGFNAKLLAKLDGVQKAAGTPGGVYVIPDGEMSPMKVEFKGFDATWTAVIMPMRM